MKQIIDTIQRKINLSISIGLLLLLTTCQTFPGVSAPVAVSSTGSPTATSTAVRAPTSLPTFTSIPIPSPSVTPAPSHPTLTPAPAQSTPVKSIQNSEDANEAWQALADGALSITLSPAVADLMITDSQGRRLGYDPVTDSEVNDIYPPELDEIDLTKLDALVSGVYLRDTSRDVSELFILSPEAGKAVLTLTGIRAGDYTLLGYFADSQASVNILRIKGTITPGQVETRTITIPTTSIEVPYPPMPQAGLDISAKVDQQVTFAGSFTDINPNDSHQIVWDFGDGSTSQNTLTPRHIYTAAGVYTVTLTVTDSAGFEIEDTLQVTVN